MENKSLKKGIDNLPFPQHYNSDILDYETVQGKNGATFVEVKNTTPILIRLEETGIFLPVDIKGSEKSALYVYDSVSELADKVITTAPFDFINQKTLSGIFICDTNSTIYIQESHNQSEWYTISKISTTASTSETINGNAYYTGTEIKYNANTRYVRVLFKLGATATTKLSIQLFGSSV